MIRCQQAAQQLHKFWGKHIRFARQEEQDANRFSISQ